MLQFSRVGIRPFVPLSILCIACAFAQDFRATLSGRVTDNSGLGIPAARVIITQKSTAQTTNVRTNQDGFYNVPYLQPGLYDVQVAADGFTAVHRADITLLTAQKLDIPFKLD